jgi:hypothetical protein
VVNWFRITLWLLPAYLFLSIEAVVKGISEGQEHILRAPGGISITYSIRVEQEENGPIAYNEGKGLIRIKWPLLYTRFEAQFKSGHRIREASYDFEKRYSTALEGKSEAVIAPYRHSWAANYLYPLRFCYFVQADQYYASGQELTTDKLLPNALEQNAYTVHPTGVIDGVPCILVQRPGFDSLWLAPSRGYMVCRREVMFGDGKPLQERTTNQNFREVVAGGWLPLKLTQEHFDLKTSRLTHTFHLEVSDVSVGSVSNRSLVVVIPEDILEVNDQFRHLIARNPQGTRPFTNALAEARRELADQRGHAWRSVRSWAITVIIMGGLIALIILGQRRVSLSRR